MAAEPRARGGFPWWFVSVLAAGLVIATLISHRPTGAATVGVARTTSSTARSRAASQVTTTTEVSTTTTFIAPPPAPVLVEAVPGAPSVTLPRTR